MSAGSVDCGRRGHALIARADVLVENEARRKDRLDWVTLGDERPDLFGRADE